MGDDAKMRSGSGSGGESKRTKRRNFYSTKYIEMKRFFEFLWFGQNSQSDKNLISYEPHMS